MAPFRLFAGVWRLIERLYDYISAYDFFISYRRSEAAKYARMLSDRLGSSYRCFFDDTDYAAPDDIVLVGNRALKRSRRLLLVASSGIAESEHVKREIEMFRKTGRPVIAIGFSGSIERLRKSRSDLCNLLAEHELHFEEPESALANGPADEIIEKIRKSVRIHGARRRFYRAIASVIVLVLILVVALSIIGKMSRDRARYRNARTFLQDELSASIFDIDTNFEVRIEGEKARRPIDLRRVVDACQILGELHLLSITDSKTTNADALGELASLKTLNLYQSQGITSIAFISTLPRLERLMLGGVGLTDDGLRHVRWPMNLQKLTLKKNNFTSTGFSLITNELDRLKNLDDLSVYDCQSIVLKSEHVESLIRHAERLKKDGKRLRLDIEKTNQSKIDSRGDLLLRLKNLTDPIRSTSDSAVSNDRRLETDSRKE